MVTRKSITLHNYYPFLTIFQPGKSDALALAIPLWDVVLCFSCCGQVSGPSDILLVLGVAVRNALLQLSTTPGPMLNIYTFFFHQEIPCEPPYH
jgi:hypothetical protein